MAKISFPGIDQYVSVMKTLEKDAEAVCKMAVYDGAGILADTIRETYNSQNHPYGGAGLIDHLAISKIRNDAGYVNAKITFGGYLDDGRPAPLVARAMESGTSRQAKKPFIRPAVRKAKTKCEAAMRKKVDSVIEKIMK